MARFKAEGSDWRINEMDGEDLRRVYLFGCVFLEDY